jgi:hypothetical protein
LRFRDIIAETVSEYSRRGEFVRIFPAKNSKIYDRYFCKNSLNKVLYKALFSSDIIPYAGNKELRPENQQDESQSRHGATKSSSSI